MSICSIASASVTPGFRDRGFERIKIHDDEIDRLDPMFLCGGFVLFFSAQIKQAAMHFRVQRFDPALEHFRETGEVGNVADFDSFLTEEARGAAGGNDFHAHL